MTRPARLLLHPDTWERHTVVGSLLRGAPTVLDVGGTPRLLARLSGRDAHRVTVANLRPPADVLIDGPRLPFPDASFSAAVSIDVVEHLAEADRAMHLRELARVSVSQVIACWPHGSPEHVEHERELQRRRPHPWLAEHLERGLPTPAAADALAEELRMLRDGDGPRFADVRLLFHGDFRRAAARHLHPLRSRLDPRRDTRLAEAPGPWTNRVFLVASR